MKVKEVSLIDDAYFFLHSYIAQFNATRFAQKCFTIKNSKQFIEIKYT